METQSGANLGRFLRKRGRLCSFSYLVPPLCRIWRRPGNFPPPLRRALSAAFALLVLGGFSLFASLPAHAYWVSDQTTIEEPFEGTEIGVDPDNGYMAYADAHAHMSGEDMVITTRVSAFGGLYAHAFASGTRRETLTWKDGGEPANDPRILLVDERLSWDFDIDDYDLESASIEVRFGDWIVSPTGHSSANYTSQYSIGSQCDTFSLDGYVHAISNVDAAQGGGAHAGATRWWFSYNPY